MFVSIPSGSPAEEEIVQFTKEFNARTAQMGVVGRLGKVLGPKGMPNPKAGTVTMDVAGAIKEIKAEARCRVDLRNKPPQKITKTKTKRSTTQKR